MIFDCVNHIAIIVSNLEVSKIFYVEKLGFKIIKHIYREQRNSSIVYLDAGNCILELFDFHDAPSRLSYPEAQGLRHLAFSVKNFDQVLKTLDDKGIKCENPRIDLRTQNRHTFFSDPDGLPIEICEYP